MHCLKSTLTSTLSFMDYQEKLQQKKEFIDLHNELPDLRPMGLIKSTTI